MMDKLEIRVVLPEDCANLKILFYENNIQEITANFNPFPLNDKTAHYIACKNQKDLYYVALKGKRFVGMAMLRGWEAGFSIPSFGIFVDHRFQNLGLGREISEFVISEARRIKCEAIRLSVYSSNQLAFNLYKKLGFEEVSREVTINDGKQIEKIIMLKILQDGK